MNDLLFAQNLARRGRVALLASGEDDAPVIVPAPVSVLDDESRAGKPFRIPLLSPEGLRSGDGRTFKKGTIDHRELPLPLLWQVQLADGHQTAVVVGRMDSMELTPRGYGNVLGVFDTGVWGREAERMVEQGFLRFVSADYDNFEAAVTEQNDQDESIIKDDEVSVEKSRIIAATIVSKPAFQECTIEIPDLDDLSDGVYEEDPALAASADEVQQVRMRLLALEAAHARRSAEERALRASALRDRVAPARADRAELLRKKAAALRDRVGSRS